MVKTRKERKAEAEIKLAYPDRSGPTEKTLLDIAQERNLFDLADQHPLNRRKKAANRKPKDESSDDDDDSDDDEEDDMGKLSPRAERVMETLLWTVSLSMLHFTLDVLVQHQYAVEIIWPQIILRALVALVVFSAFFYILHPHASSPSFLPFLPERVQNPLRQTIFFLAGTLSGCYLIHISNTFGYLYIMKRSPPLGCLWVWCIIELNLPLALISLGISGGLFFLGGYSVRL